MHLSLRPALTAQLVNIVSLALLPRVLLGGITQLVALGMCHNACCVRQADIVQMLELRLSRCV